MWCDISDLVSLAALAGLVLYCTPVAVASRSAAVFLLPLLDKGSKSSCGSCKWRMKGTGHPCARRPGTACSRSLNTAIQPGNEVAMATGKQHNDDAMAYTAMSAERPRRAYRRQVCLSICLAQCGSILAPSYSLVAPGSSIGCAAGLPVVAAGLARRYGPLFGKAFCRYAFPKKRNPVLESPPGALPASILFALLRNMLLAYLFTLVELNYAHQVLVLGFMLWFFGSSFSMVNFLFEKRPLQLWALHAMHHFACIALNCTLVGVYVLR